MFLVGAQLRPVFQSAVGNSLKLAGLLRGQSIDGTPKSGHKSGQWFGGYLGPLVGESIKATVYQTVVRAPFRREQGRFAKTLAWGQNLMALKAHNQRVARPDPSYLMSPSDPSRGGTRTLNLLGHTPDRRMNESPKDVARWLVGWLRREKLSAPYVINEFEKVVEALPDGSLSLAASRAVLFEKAARGVRQDGKGRDLNG